MGNLVAMIKKAAVEAVQAEKPMNIRMGTVTDCKPFSIRLSGKLLLTHEFLLITKSYYDRAEVGDKVLVLSYPGGQKFVVMDRVVNV